MHALCRLKPNSNSSKEDGQFIQELIIRPNILTALDKEHSFANRYTHARVSTKQKFFVKRDWDEEWAIESEIAKQAKITRANMQVIVYVTRLSQPLFYTFNDGSSSFAHRSTQTKILTRSDLSSTYDGLYDNCIA
ncbi:hypothetical protein ALC56_13627 [Trachymyrmex septentrionalis]|uniref:Uncharacterized protein n=1 Tax=Trachymyrmex septentrionalis TaxID=34720 RepID=A0A195EVI2_9HYME|nr:hypothetical protein ALC56_13627 [Trachymyrmex septentrionalis]